MVQFGLCRKRHKTACKKAHAKAISGSGSGPVSLDSKPFVVPAGLSEGSGVVTEPPTTHQYDHCDVVFVLCLSSFMWCVSTIGLVWAQAAHWQLHVATFTA